MASEPVVKELFIDAPPEVVFEFFTDPGKMVQWLGIAAQLEPRPGGLFRVDPTGKDARCGTFLEVVPHSRIVFTWGWERQGGLVPAGGSRVEVDLRPSGSGTHLRLVHSRLPENAREEHSGGWDHRLGRLKTVAEGRDPGVDPCADPSGR